MINEQRIDRVAGKAMRILRIMPVGSKCLRDRIKAIQSAFLCADLGITPAVREDHAAYISSWLQALQNDRRCIFTAATHAQRAVDYLQSLPDMRLKPIFYSFRGECEAQCC